MQAHVVHRNHVRVLDPRCHLRLAEEPLPERVIGAQLRGEHLERHGRTEARVLGSVNDAHPAAADDRLDQIVAELTADDQVVSHGGRV